MAPVPRWNVCHKQLLLNEDEKPPENEKPCLENMLCSLIFNIMMRGVERMHRRKTIVEQKQEKRGEAAVRDRRSRHNQRRD